MIYFIKGFAKITRSVCFPKFSRVSHEHFSQNLSLALTCGDKHEKNKQTEIVWLRLYAQWSCW